MTTKHILGIDIAKLKFDVHLRTREGDGPGQQQCFPNNSKGFKALLKWLLAQGVKELHVCLEATSRYGDALAAFLYDHGYQVSLVNPRRIRHYADSQLTRTQNDAIDARLIADFCASQQKLALWEPRSPAHCQLQDLTRARQTLVEQQEGFTNQLETARGLARASFQRQIGSLEREILRLDKAMKELVQKTPELTTPIELADSVTGVGFITAATVVAELPPVDKMAQASQAVAYAGLDPRRKTSGTSVKTTPHLSRMGSSRLRKALYMPAIVALKYNPIVRALGQRLAAKGKRGKYVIAAAMRKLLRLIFGVIKTGSAFDPHWKNSNAPQPKAAR